MSGNTIGQFFGFTSDTPFNSVSISPMTDAGAGAPFSYTLDNLVYGNITEVPPAAPVPEPSTWSLLVSGLGFLAWRACRWRHSNVSDSVEH